MLKKAYSVSVVSANYDKEFLNEVRKMFEIIVVSPMTLKKRPLLEWFRNFAYSDIDRLEEEQKIKLYVEYKSVLAGGLDIGVCHNFGKGTKVIEGLKDHQIWFKNAFVAIMEKIEDIENHEIKKWSSDENHFNYLGYWPLEGKKPPADAFSFNLIPDHISVNFNTLSYIEIAREDREKEKGNDGPYKEARWHPKWKENSVIRTITYPTTIPNTYLLYLLLEALNDVKFKMCKRCAECDQWFFNLSNRQKMYCSNRCAARKRMRDSRAKLKEEDDKAYKLQLEENKKRARKSFVIKRAEEGHKKYQREREEKGW